MSNFSENLRKLRRERNYTQQELGKRIQSSALVVSLFENGQQEPSIDTLIELAKVFDVTLDELVGAAKAVEA